jgi:endonuclease YncB( thermonuclease family)
MRCIEAHNHVRCFQFVLSALSLCMLIAPALATDLIGQTSVVDGDTIEIHGQRIRLWGVDAPESGQLCRGADSEIFRCGSGRPRNQRKT